MTTRQKDRIPIDSKTRKEVLERDNHACLKCGGKRRLHLHHILPSALGGLPLASNLLTLCDYCHREWEYHTFRRTDTISLDEWIKLPTYLAMATAFQHRELWTDEYTAKEFLEQIFKGWESVRAFRSDSSLWDDIAYEEEIQSSWWKTAKQEKLFAA